MAEPRLTAAIAVNALVRTVFAQGDFATVVRKGDPDSGEVALIITSRGNAPFLLLKQPTPDGTTVWEKSINLESRDAIDAMLQRRMNRDPDLWIVELDVADPERLVVLIG